MENEMIKACLADGAILKDAISLVSDLITETNLHIKKECFEITAMDAANVAMIILKLKSNMFTEYNVPNDIRVGLNLSNFKHILKRMKPKDITYVKYADNMLHVSYRDASKTRDFKLPTINIEEKDAKLPAFDFKAKITTLSEMLASAIDDVEIVGESASFSATENKFLIVAEGELNQAKVEMKKDDMTKILLSDGKESKSKYSVEYLKKMVQASKLCDNVAINFSNSYPLQLCYQNENFELVYILAPRVDE